MNKRNKTVAEASGITIKKVVSRNGRVSYHMTVSYWATPRELPYLQWCNRVEALGIVNRKKVFTNKPEAEKFMSFAILSLSG
jgi:hypothetical protein